VALLDKEGSKMDYSDTQVQAVYRVMKMLDKHEEGKPLSKRLHDACFDYALISLTGLNSNNSNQEVEQSYDALYTAYSEVKTFITEKSTNFSYLFPDDKEFICGLANKVFNEL